MPKCPNCGQAALRTKDWACQWCGYPLVSASYREIPKTYKELKEEILHEEEPPVTEETGVTSQPDESTLLPTSTLEPEPEPAVKEEPEPVPEPESAVKEELEPVPEPEPVPKPKSKSKAKSKQKSKPGSGLKSKPKKILKSKPGSKSAVVEVTFEGLNSAFEADSAAADAELANRILKVTGLAGVIAVDDNMDNPCIILTSPDETISRKVLCVFDKENGPELRRLTIGQTVTVQGKYNGCTINVLMLDCALVS